MKRLAIAMPAFLLAVLALAAPNRTPIDVERLTVHEWGTFTSLQDERGISLPGINSDDEPVPGFVHRLPYSIKGGGPHPDVILRLETPVLYFYPPALPGASRPIDVRVRFPDGWLTEYYPDAVATAPELAPIGFLPPRMKPGTEGVLRWKGLSLGGEGHGPETEDPVWTSPREVRAASVATPKGESEKYLFYRGVGRIEAPLQVARAGDRLVIRRRPDADPPADEPGIPGPLWLLEIRPDGGSAFRTVVPPSIDPGPRGILAEIPASFPAGAFTSNGVNRLRGEMHAALAAAGLFEDEAAAMLKTWERSYFRSPGARIFFLLPRAWTDRRLPLEISEPADVERVMVGRIELVTPHQRGRLSRLASGAASGPDWMDALPQADRDRLYRVLGGHEPPEAIAGAVPADYRAYLDLGRFRDALVLDETRHFPGGAAARFARTYGIRFSPDPSR